MTSGVVVCIAFVGVLCGPPGAWLCSRARSGASRIASSWRKPWTPALTFDGDLGTAIVPVRFGLELFTEMFDEWRPIGIGHSAKLTVRADGTYDLSFATVPVVRPPGLEELEPNVRNAVAAAIDLLHAVDEQATDVSANVEQAASAFREAVHPLTH